VTVFRIVNRDISRFICDITAYMMSDVSLVSCYILLLLFAMTSEEVDTSSLKLYIVLIFKTHLLVALTNKSNGFVV
jgi:hypothetical protein